MISKDSHLFEITGDHADIFFGISQLHGFPSERVTIFLSLACETAKYKRGSSVKETDVKRTELLLVHLLHVLIRSPGGIKFFLESRYLRFQLGECHIH